MPNAMAAALKPRAPKEILKVRTAQGEQTSDVKVGGDGEVKGAMVEKHGLYINIYIYIYLFIYLFIYLCVCIYIYNYIYIIIYIYTYCYITSGIWLMDICIFPEYFLITHIPMDG